MKYYLIIVFSFVLLSACDYHWPRKNEITKIEIATGGCFGPCQLTAVSIDSTLTYHYFGGESPFFSSSAEDIKNGKIKGYYAANITPGFWDTLNIKLEGINYKKLNSSYERTVDDESLEVIIHYGNNIKHIRAQDASLPDSVAKVFYYVVKSYKSIKPKRSKDTFTFETTIQRPILPPKVDDVKFPPVSKSK